VEKDLEKAVSLYKKACDMGQAIGCSNLGVMYEKGEGMENDFERAAFLYQKACYKGHAIAYDRLKELQ